MNERWRGILRGKRRGRIKSENEREVEMDSKREEERENEREVEMDSKRVKEREN